MVIVEEFIKFDSEGHTVDHQQRPNVTSRARSTIAVPPSGTDRSGVTIRSHGSHIP